MPTKIIAMWSGPRNISTAMMRSWGNRADTYVIDEPFYAHYLQHTGSPHPGAEQIVQSQPTDWRAVAEALTTKAPTDRPVFYQKHITTHMLPHIELEWLRHINHCFLIRDPAKVVASYSQQRPNNAANDLGFAQQERLFNFVCAQQEKPPPVIDSDLFLQDPRGQLQAVCEHLDLEFSDDMLQWEPGVRETDGIWHQWWYEAVASSTGFRPYKPKPVELNSQQKKIVSECEPHYLVLRSHALTTNPNGAS